MAFPIGEELTQAELTFHLNVDNNEGSPFHPEGLNVAESRS